MKTVKFLIPVDFSKCSMNALNSAIHIARRINAHLTIFHVKQEMILQENELSHFDDEILDDELRSKFEEMTGSLRDLKEVSYDEISRYGEVDVQVASVCRELEIDLVIMGTKGSSGIYEVLMGSNTYAVVKSSRVPVLVIPQGSEIDEIHQIALAGDYKPIDAESLEPVKMLASIDGADIHIVHIGDSNSLSENEKAQAVKYDRYLKNYRHHYHLILGNDVEESLQSYCIQRNIDVLAMIPRKHKLFDRVFDGGETKNMVFHTKIPLLTIPE